MPLFGVDVSTYQGPCNFAQTAAWRGPNGERVAFVLAKATEGIGYIDDQYPRSKAAIPDAGLISGAYHFLRGTHDGASQAEAFIEAADPHSMHVLDVECIQDVHTFGRPLDVSGFVKRHAQLLPGHDLIRYSGRDFWHACADGISGGPLWAAGNVPNAYVLGSGDLATQWAKTGGHPTSGLPWGGWTDWTMLQFTDRALVPGIAGPVDGNAYRGTLEQLRALTGQETDMPLSDDDAAKVARAVHNQLLFGSDTTIGKAIYETYRRTPLVVPTAADIAAVLLPALTAAIKALPAGTATVDDATISRLAKATIDELNARLVR